MNDNNGWITDRLPTAEDADEYGKVWFTDRDGNVLTAIWDEIVVDEPWMHVTVPEPYIRPSINARSGNQGATGTRCQGIHDIKEKTGIRSYLYLRSFTNYMYQYMIILLISAYLFNHIDPWVSIIFLIGAAIFVSKNFIKSIQAY